jgi:hypothetical protein
MQGQQKKVPSARLNLLVLHSNPLERAELQEQPESELQGQLDLLVLLAHREGRQGQLVLQAKGRLGLQDYLALTELRGLRVFAELQEAQAFKGSKVLQDCKVLLGLAHRELQEQLVNKGRLGHKDQLEWSALADQRD